MQSFTIAESAIRDKVREGFATIVSTVRQRFADAGLPNPDEEAALFVGCGMTVVMSELLALPELNPNFTQQ
jgi:hypothetical protein